VATSVEAKAAPQLSIIVLPFANISNDPGGGPPAQRATSLWRQKMPQWRASLGYSVGPLRVLTMMQSCASEAPGGGRAAMATAQTSKGAAPVRLLGVHPGPLLYTKVFLRLEHRRSRPARQDEAVWPAPLTTWNLTPPPDRPVRPSLPFIIENRFIR
jgi:hypothetical protein